MNEALNPCPICLTHAVGRFNPKGNSKIGELRTICIRCQNIKQNLGYKTKYAKPSKSYDEKKCKFCDRLYQQKTKTHQYCTFICREQARTKEKNDKWFNREYKPPHALSMKARENFTNSEAYSKKTLGWTKKYNSVRG